MKITRIGIDLAKQVFQVHGVDERGKPVWKRQLRRTQVLPLFANLPPTLIGMVGSCGATPPASKKITRLGACVR